MTGAISTRPTVLRGAAPTAAVARSLHARPTATHGVSLVELGEMIRTVESIPRRGPAFAAISTEWPAPFDRMARGVLHEWFCADERSSRSSRSSRSWHAPLLVFAHLARLAWSSSPASAGALLIWIGRRVWPQPQVLMHADRPALHRSLLIDPSSDAERLWAIDLSLRSPAVAAVMADASGMTLPHSRRLQLAAEHGGSLALLARPAREMATPSTAAMRWRIRPAPSPTTRPRWSIELTRCKGVQRMAGTEAGTPSLVLEHDRETGRLRIPADLAD